MKTITDLKRCSCHNCKHKLDEIFWKIILYNFPDERIPEDGA